MLCIIFSSPATLQFVQLLASWQFMWWLMSVHIFCHFM